MRVSSLNTHFKKFVLPCRIKAVKIFTSKHDGTTRKYCQLRCSEHGLLSSFTRLAKVLKKGPGCWDCKQRLMVEKNAVSKDEIEKKLNANPCRPAQKLLSVTPGHDGKKRTANVHCSIHGSYSISVGLVMHRNQACSECGFKLAGDQRHISLIEKNVCTEITLKVKRQGSNCCVKRSMVKSTLSSFAVLSMARLKNRCHGRI